MQSSIRNLVDAIKSTIEKTPPELVADLMTRGIIMAGGGSLLRGLPELIAEETGVPVELTDDPLTAVVRGTGLVLEDIEGLREILLGTQFESAPK